LAIVEVCRVKHGQSRRRIRKGRERPVFALAEGMTTQLIRMQAKEIAGIFYEQNQRTLRFRRQWPVQDDYVDSQWPHFVQSARPRWCS
jgi:hypothetical protein